MKCQATGLPRGGASELLGVSSGIVAPSPGVCSQVVPPGEFVCYPGSAVSLRKVIGALISLSV